MTNSIVNPTKTKGGLTQRSFYFRYDLENNSIIYIHILGDMLHVLQQLFICIEEELL